MCMRFDLYTLPPVLSPAPSSRLSGHGEAILVREKSKLSYSTIMGSTCCWCDILTSAPCILVPCILTS